METLEIFADASLRNIGNRVFTCSGALCPNTHEERYVITQDSTNNRGELLAVYLAVCMAARTRDMYPERFKDINIYSDSQFVVFGLTKWMASWLNHRDDKGVLYGSSGFPVKNQEMFMMIITYCVINKLVVHFYHQKGHVNTASPKELASANNVFRISNGHLLNPEDIFKISFYNDIVDKNSRFMLQNINPNDYPMVKQYKHNKKIMCKYVIPSDYTRFIQ